MYLDLNELPDMVDANDEGLFADVAETVAIDMEVDVRHANGNMLDEYHDVPLYENYPDDLDPELSLDGRYDRPNVVLVPKQSMIDLARDEVSYYSSQDVHSPQRWVMEGKLIGMPFEERVKIIRAYLDQYLTTPYKVRPYGEGVFTYSVYQGNQCIGHVHFLDDITKVHYTMGIDNDHILADIIKRHA